MSGFADDVADISVVVSHLTRELDYTIALIVGHSRGSVSGLTWMCTAPEGQTVRGYVNCSGRYRMEVGLSPILPCTSAPFRSLTYMSLLLSSWYLHVSATLAEDLRQVTV
jgi:alpha-beta hydrolase superfamily lysophospholipase